MIHKKLRAIAFIVMACACTLASAAPVGQAEVKHCAQDIFQRALAGACSNYFSLESVKKIDARETSTDVYVIAEISLRAKQRMAAQSQAATECTGTAWNVQIKNPYPPNTSAWLMYQSQANMDGGYIETGQGLVIRKKFKFEHWDSGWRCAEAQMSPIDRGWFVNTPVSEAPSIGSSPSTSPGPGVTASGQQSASTGPQTPSDMGGEGALVVRQVDADGPAPIYSNEIGDNVAAHANNGEGVSGMTGKFPYFLYRFEHKNKRLRVSYFVDGKSGMPHSGWMDERDLTTFQYSCRCETQGVSFHDCSPYKTVFPLIREWNSCFIEARDKKLEELRRSK